MVTVVVAVIVAGFQLRFGRNILNQVISMSKPIKHRTHPGNADEAGSHIEEVDGGEKTQLNGPAEIMSELRLQEGDLAVMSRFPLVRLYLISLSDLTCKHDELGLQVGERVEVIEG